MTIKEIAQLAGVSQAAISRYLNDGYVSEEKKVKIKKVIDQTGYKPSIQAQMLRTKKTKLIGVVLPKINSEAISRMVSGISSVISENGYQMLLANTENKVEKEIQYLHLFRENPVDGILFIATIFQKEHKDFLKNTKIPVVVLGQQTDLVSSVCYDDFGAAKELTHLMIEAGKKNIAYIGVTSKDKAAGLDRKQGYIKAIQQGGLAYSEQMVIEGDFSIQSGYRNMQLLMQREKNLDGVFCATDSIAIGAMNYLKEIGKKIPFDINIVGIGHTQLSEVVQPQLTTAHFYYKTSGKDAADLLLNMIEQHKKRIVQTRLGYEIIKTNSIG